MSQLSLQPRLDCLWWIDNATIGGRIHGSLPNKSNSREMIWVPAGKGRKKVPRWILSAEARVFSEIFEYAAATLPKDDRLPLAGATTLDQIKQGRPGIFLDVTVYVDNLRRDLDAELLPDLLQEHGIINNDRGLWDKHQRRRLDRDNPRVEFRLGIMQEAL